jgi:hypothetical protein
MRIVQSTGFVVDETNDTVVFDRSTSTKYIATVTRGVYASLGDLAPAVATAMNAASVSSFTFSEPSNSLAESTLYLYQEFAGDPATVRVWFANHTGTDNVTAETHEKCAKLFALLGFDTNAAADIGSGTGVSYLSIPDSTYAMARSSPENTRTFKLQISGLNLRIKEFARRPV